MTDNQFREKLEKIIVLFDKNTNVYNYVTFFREVDLTKREFDEKRKHTSKENERLVDMLETIEYSRILNMAMDPDKPNTPLIKDYLESKHDLGTKVDYEKTTQSAINEIAKKIGFKGVAVNGD